MIQKNMFIYKNDSVKDALKKLDKTAEKVLLVINEMEQLLGTINDGDIRRFILRGGKLENDIADVYNKRPNYLAQKDFSIERAKSMLIENRIDLIPLLNEEKKVVNFITWSEAFSDGKVSTAMKSEIDVPVVIMAGGKSTRLEPFNKILPKALIPIGDKPIIEIIMEEFKKHGVRQYYLILNYKSDIIESYFKNIEKDYKITYIKENDFLGTAGGLALLEKKISDNFIVSNCDVIVKAHFEEAINFHKENDASLTILSSFQHHKIPYGVVKFVEKGRVVDVIEKPEYTFTINTGVYILNKGTIEFIPKETYFDMTDLVKYLLKNNKKVFTYPVNENDYIDIGQWDEYKKALDKLR